ncbi:MAG: type 11 methyltransferase [Parcubacteria group bacterium]|nr:type 11 methyltransferase [Parcubacteria group bacterium]
MKNDPIHNVLEFGFIPGQKVADLGSGSGFYTAALSTAVGNMGRVIAVDLEPSSLSRLKKTAMMEGRQNIEVMIGDIERGTSLRSGVLDGAVFSHIFSRLEDKAGACAEAKRIVKKGGKVCLVEKMVGIREVLETSGLVFERAFDAGRGQTGYIFKN